VFLLFSQAKDMVRMVQREMKAALEEERYGDAARLRDEGMASLQVCVVCAHVCVRELMCMY
jgi:hypothetical protein